MDVKRYAPVYLGVQYNIREDKDGAYVTFADYDRLRKLYESACDVNKAWNQVEECDPQVRGECVREAWRREAAHDTMRKKAGL